MATFYPFVFVLLFCTLVAVYADMKLDCQPNFLSLVWTETRPQVDASLFRLGNCFPTSVTPSQAVFTVALDDCKFTQLVTGDRMVYSYNLTYVSSPESQLALFSRTVICDYQRPKDWHPMLYNPVFDTRGQGELIFHIEIMNNDLTAPAEYSSFPLGALIPILANVQQASHQPLQLYIEECFAATTPVLFPNSQIYPVVTNKGCLMDSKQSSSRFMRRHKSSEILLLLQAFKFSSASDQVYLHCKLVAWDPTGFDKAKKACNYIQGQGWKMVDNPSYSNLCDCCESNCYSRQTRTSSFGNHEMMQEAVLGPMTITDSVQTL